MAVTHEGLNAWWRAALAFFGSIFRTIFRQRIVALDRVPAGGPAILAPNHVSVLDGPVLAMVVARHGRPVRFLVTSGAFKIPVVGLVLRLFRQIPVRRGEQNAGALDEAIVTVRRGALAGVFPEGRVNDPPARALQRGRTGLARVALATGAPVIPVGIWGTQARWPRGGPWRRQPLRPPLALVFGEPIEPHGDADDWDAVEAFTALVMDAIRACVAEAQRLTGGTGT